jgi:hypothetical protein
MIQRNLFITFNFNWFVQLTKRPGILECYKDNWCAVDRFYRK